MNSPYSHIIENPSMRDWQLQNVKEMSRDAAARLTIAAVQMLLYLPRGHHVNVQTLTDSILFARKPGTHDLIALTENDELLTVAEAFDNIRSDTVTGLYLGNTVTSERYTLYRSPLH